MRREGEPMNSCTGTAHGRCSGMRTLPVPTGCGHIVRLDPYHHHRTRSSPFAETRDGHPLTWVIGISWNTPAPPLGANELGGLVAGMRVASRSQTPTPRNPRSAGRRQRTEVSRDQSVAEMRSKEEKPRQLRGLNQIRVELGRYTTGGNDVRQIRDGVLMARRI